jgi:DNA-binding CsgD family transcriptional regulator
MHPLLGKHLVQIHSTDNQHELCVAVTRAVEEMITSHVVLIGFKPQTFELALYINKPKLQKRAEQYAAKDYKDDIWLKRSPVHPRVKVVRHSDFTPSTILERSRWYKNVLKPIGSYYGASLVAWQKGVWLAMVTIHRSKTQGDFTADDMEVMKQIQIHFSVAIRRLAAKHEEQLRRQSLDAFIQNFPFGFILLDWRLNVVHFNHEANLRCSELTHGKFRAQHLKTERYLRLPPFVRQSLEEIKKTVLSNQKRRFSLFQSMRKTFRSTGGMDFTITFVPALAPGVNLGLFLIVFTMSHLGREGNVVETGLLSKTEQEVFAAIRQGLKNQEIADRFSKSLSTVRNQVSTIFQKLNVRNRASLLARYI